MTSKRVRVANRASAILFLSGILFVMLSAREAGMLTVTLLGTGTPFPDTDRYGAAILVQAGQKNLLFDSGRGTVIRLAGAGVPVAKVSDLFLTHLHSDHVVGIPDLWLTGWFLGRASPLRMWGPSIVTGRPAGLATGSDGALYVSDDAKGFIYRIAYDGIGRPAQ